MKFLKLFIAIMAALLLAGCSSAEEGTVYQSVEEIGNARIGLILGTTHDAFATASFTDAQIIRIHTEQTGDQRTVGTVSAAGLRKGAVEEQADGFWLICQKGARHTADANCAGGMRTGGAIADFENTANGFHEINTPLSDFKKHCGIL